MTVLAIAPGFNSPGKHDATGAFHPEAGAYVRAHGGRRFLFDNRRPDGVRFATTMGAIGASSGLAGVGFFCHGFRSGLQIGATLRNVGTLAWALKGSLLPGTPVTLYACDAARDLDADRADDLARGPAGDGGFASLLAEALGAEHWVDAHVTTAHTTINPYVRRFVADGPGDWIVVPGTPEFRHWADRLRTDRDFRLSFPFWTVERIRAMF